MVTKNIYKVALNSLPALVAILDEKGVILNLILTQQEIHVATMVGSAGQAKRLQIS